MAGIWINALAILALGVYIFIARRAASSGGVQGPSTWFRMLLVAFFVCAALSFASALSVLLAAAQGQVLARIPVERSLDATLRPWTVASGYLLGNVLTALAFRRMTFRYFRALSGAS